MTDRLTKLQQEILEEVEKISDLETLERFRAVALGKQGVIPVALKKIGQKIKETKE